MFVDKKLIYKIKVFQKLKPKTGKRITTLFFPIAILIVIFAFIGEAYFISGENQSSSSPEATTASPTSAPTPTLAPTNDPDPIVSCNFQYLGVKQIRSSECSKSFECQIAGRWYIYTSSDKCTQDQNKNTAQNPSFDWSSYRAAKIRDLQGALKITNESIAYLEKEKAKYAQYSADAVALYQSGQRTTEEFNKIVESLDKADALIESDLQEAYRDREKYTTLIKRFENGENISSAEEKAILGN